MNCYNVRKYLEKMAAGLIDGFLARRIQDHLQNCPACREEYQEIKQALEIAQQTPDTKPVRQIGPVWRQRIRQEALKNEASRRSFFSVFKANTLIPALGALAVLVVFGMLNVYHRFAPKVTIEPQIKKYSPAMSSTVGIPLTARFTGGKTPRNITFHWTTEYGCFLSWDGGKATELGADIRTQENEVYWSIDPREKSTISSFIIYLQVEAFKTGNTIAQATLGLEKEEDGFFVVRK